MKLGKGAGPYRMPIEAWKVIEDCGVSWPTQFFNRVVTEGKLQAE